MELIGWLSSTSINFMAFFVMVSFSLSLISFSEGKKCTVHFAEKTLGFSVGSRGLFYSVFVIDKD